MADRMRVTSLILATTALEGTRRTLATFLTLIPANTDERQIIMGPLADREAAYVGQHGEAQGRYFARRRLEQGSEAFDAVQFTGRIFRFGHAVRAQNETVAGFERQRH